MLISMKDSAFTIFAKEIYRACVSCYQCIYICLIEIQIYICLIEIQIYICLIEIQIKW